MIRRPTTTTTSFNPHQGFQHWTCVSLEWSPATLLKGATIPQDPFVLSIGPQCPSMSLLNPSLLASRCCLFCFSIHGHHRNNSLLLTKRVTIAGGAPGNFQPHYPTLAPDCLPASRCVLQPLIGQHRLFLHIHLKPQFLVSCCPPLPFQLVKLALPFHSPPAVLPANYLLECRGWCQGGDDEGTEPVCKSLALSNVIHLVFGLGESRLDVKGKCFASARFECDLSGNKAVNCPIFLFPSLRSAIPAMATSNGTAKNVAQSVPGRRPPLTTTDLHFSRHPGHAPPVVDR